MWEQSEWPAPTDVSEWTRLDDARHHLDRGEYGLAAEALRAGDDLLVTEDEAGFLCAALAGTGLRGVRGPGGDLFVCAPSDAADLEAELREPLTVATGGETPERKPAARALPPLAPPARRSRARPRR